MRIPDARLKAEQRLTKQIKASMQRSLGMSVAQYINSKEFKIERNTLLPTNAAPDTQESFSTQNSSQTTVQSHAHHGHDHPHDAYKQDFSQVALQMHSQQHGHAHSQL